MAHKVIWSPEAIEDLDSIAEYIIRDSPQHAISVIDRALEMAARLSEFPFSGRVIPERSNHYLREQFIYSYRFMYSIQNDSIIVIAIIHARRSLDYVSERLQHS